MFRQSHCPTLSIVLIIKTEDFFLSEAQMLGDFRVLGDFSRVQTVRPSILGIDRVLKDYSTGLHGLI